MSIHTVGAQLGSDLHGTDLGPTIYFLVGAFIVRYGGL